MHVVEQGEGPPVILCHGFPELAYSWRHQLTALAEAGYRAIAPDQRGYGRTDVPEPVEDYDIEHLTGDLVGLLDELGEERAVFVGHDWGAIVVWQLAVMAPERVAGVAALSVPFVPRTPVPPTQLMAAVAGDTLFYIVYFQEVGPADQELNREPRATVANMMWAFGGEAPRGTTRRVPRDGSGYLDQFTGPPRMPSWLTQKDLDVYAGEFGRTGFTGALNWYRNFDRNWELTERFADARVEVPALYVAGERDPVLRMTPPAVMDGWLADPRGQLLLPGVGHWTQQEDPEGVNRALLEFLRDVWPDPVGSGSI